MNQGRHSQRQARAQSIIEVACGAIVLVPIALLVIDVVFVFGAIKANNELAQSAARLAGNKSSQDAANMAARTTVADFSGSPNESDATLEQFQYDELSKMVTVKTQMTVKLPVPLPGAATTLITAVSTQPIVGIPAAR